MGNTFSKLLIISATYAAASSIPSHGLVQTNPRVHPRFTRQIYGTTVPMASVGDDAELSEFIETLDFPELVTHLAIGSAVTDLTPIQTLKGLMHLNLSRSRVTSLDPLRGLTALEEINCEHTLLSDLTPLQGLTALQTLIIGHTQVSSLAPLLGLTAMQYLSFGHTQVTDLAPLQGLTSLQYLSFDHTHVTDLVHLKGLTALQKLHMSNTLVFNLTPLHGLLRLTLVDARETRVAMLAGLKMQTESGTLQNLWLTGCPIASFPPWAAKWEAEYVRVTLRTLTGATVQLVVDPNWIILSLTSMLYSMRPFPTLSGEPRLILSSEGAAPRVLGARESLRSLGVNGGGEITLHVIYGV